MLVFSYVTLKLAAPFTTADDDRSNVTRWSRAYDHFNCWHFVCYFSRPLDFFRSLVRSFLSLFWFNFELEAMNVGRANESINSLFFSYLIQFKIFSKIFNKRQFFEGTQFFFNFFRYNFRFAVFFCQVLLYLWRSLLLGQTAKTRQDKGNLWQTIFFL